MCECIKQNLEKELCISQLDSHAIFKVLIATWSEIKSCQFPITLYGVSGTVEPSVEYAWLSSTVDKSTYVWGGFSFLGIYSLLWCLLDLFFMICRAMKKITNRLIANNVETLAMMATPVVISLFSIKTNLKFYFKYTSTFTRLIKANC